MQLAAAVWLAEELPHPSWPLSNLPNVARDPASHPPRFAARRLLVVQPHAAREEAQELKDGQDVVGQRDAVDAIPQPARRKQCNPEKHRCNNRCCVATLWPVRWSDSVATNVLGQVAVAARANVGARADEKLARRTGCCSRGDEEVVDEGRHDSADGRDDGQRDGLRAQQAGGKLPSVVESCRPLCVRGENNTKWHAPRPAWKSSCGSGTARSRG